MVTDRQTVGWIQRQKPDLLFTENDGEVIEDRVGNVAGQFDSFFVQTNKGEYSEVWGMYGTVPWKLKSVYRIK